MEQVAYYKRNAMVIYEGLKEAGYTVFGGINSPYIWLKVEDGMDSWEFLTIFWNRPMWWEHREAASGPAARVISA